MKRNDLILITITIVCSAVFFIYFNFNMQQGDKVVVNVDGMEYGTYDLDRDQIITINDTNVLEINNGVAIMIEANCPDGLCLHQSSICNNGESIICLPNRVIVEVISDDETQYDVITQ